MPAGGAIWAKTEERIGAIGQIGSDIPTGTPCLVCCVVEPLPSGLLSVSRINVQVTLALVTVEHENHVGVAAVSLMDVELVLGHGG